jgi:hypothetical protein
MSLADTRVGHMEHVESSSFARAEYDTVRFYESDSALARFVAEFLHDGFDGGSPGIVIATADQRAAIIRELTERLVDVVALQRSHWVPGEQIGSRPAVRHPTPPVTGTEAR